MRRVTSSKFQRDRSQRLMDRVGAIAKQPDRDPRSVCQRRDTAHEMMLFVDDPARPRDELSDVWLDTQEVQRPIRRCIAQHGGRIWIILRREAERFGKDQSLIVAEFGALLETAVAVAFAGRGAAEGQHIADRGHAATPDCDFGTGAKFGIAAEDGRTGNILQIAAGFNGDPRPTYGEAAVHPEDPGAGRRRDLDGGVAINLEFEFEPVAGKQAGGAVQDNGLRQIRPAGIEVEQPLHVKGR